MALIDWVVAGVIAVSAAAVGQTGFEGHGNPGDSNGNPGSSNQAGNGNPGNSNQAGQQGYEGQPGNQGG